MEQQQKISAVEIIVGIFAFVYLVGGVAVLVGFLALAFASVL